MTTSLTREAIGAVARAVGRITDPDGADEWLALLRLLYATGRRDLPLGRVVEGHLDAIQIITRYGSPHQVAAVREGVRNGRLFGVWGADYPDAPPRVQEGRLSGGKAFASGAGLLTDALIPVDAEGGRQLLWIDLAIVPPAIDRDWWHVTGMARSETHRVLWTDAPLPPGARVGEPSDYIREPWFSGGALRFTAVQAGGIAALVDRTRDHLSAAMRTDDPFQARRLIELYGAAQAAADAVRRAGLGWSTSDIAGTLARVAAARVAVYAAGEDALRLAAAAVGAQAAFVDHPLAAAMRDLDVYLRQPAPDAQVLAAGAAVASGVLVPQL